MIKDFRAHKVVYNRNGIMGKAFWSVAFSFDNEGTFCPNMLAIFPYGGSIEGISVVDLNDLTQNWRGANFFEDVGDAICAHQKSVDL